MSSKSNLDKIHIRSRKVREITSSFWSKAWPIRRDLFHSPDRVLKAIASGSKLIQSLIALSIIGLIVSVIMIGTGVYGLFSQEVLNSGGYIQEVAINEDLELFNPVLNLTSPAEIKVSNLLFHPLYTVEFPNFSSGAVTEPTITPVLLEMEPQWADSEAASSEDKFKTLNFTLKSNLKWSDGTPITTDDMQYSFDRIREAKGNSRFREIFRQINFQKQSDTEFSLLSKIPNPQLKFTSGFYPVSKNYFDSLNTDRLFADNRSTTPAVTSGYYSLVAGKQDDPLTPEKDEISNPLRSERSNRIQQVILTPNKVVNYKEPSIDNYIFRRLTGVFDNPNSSSDLTLEKQAQEGRVDLFTRSLSTNLNLTTKEIEERISLDSKVVPTNTFYSLFLNVRSGQYFINANLRKFVMCKLIAFEGNEIYKDALTPLADDQKLIPLQLQETRAPGCPEDLDSLILEDDTGAYTITESESGSPRINVYNQQPVLTIVGLSESQPLLSEIVDYFDREIGLELELVQNSSQVQTALSDKEYDIAFLPITYVSPDITSLYGESGRGISEIRQNQRLSLRPDEFEATLEAYSLSNYTDAQARTTLADFFAQNNISITLYQASAEFNYSNRIAGLEDNLPELYLFAGDIYNKLPQWFASSKRELK